MQNVQPRQQVSCKKGSKPLQNNLDSPLKDIPPVYSNQRYLIRTNTIPVKLRSPVPTSWIILQQETLPTQEVAQDVIEPFQLQLEHK